jgi:hypothetical protein
MLQMWFYVLTSLVFNPVPKRYESILKLRGLKSCDTLPLISFFNFPQPTVFASILLRNVVVRPPAHLRIEYTVVQLLA